MNRIAALRKQFGMSQKSFGTRIGAAQNTVSNWENGNRSIDLDTASEIADLFNVSVDYLFGRDDDSFTAAPAPTRPGSKWIPVLGRVQAGVPTDAVEDILDYEEISAEMTQQGEYMALQVKGHSMEPKISEGDVVIVLKQPDAETGDIVVVLVNGDEATVKKIKKRPEGIMLIPSNPAFDPMFYSNEQIERLPVVIVGKVVELRAKF